MVQIQRNSGTIAYQRIKPEEIRKYILIFANNWDKLSLWNKINYPELNFFINFCVFTV